MTHDIDERDLKIVLPQVLEQLQELEQGHQAGNLNETFCELGLALYARLTGLEVSESNGLFSFEFSEHPYIPVSLSLIIQKMTYQNRSDSYQSLQGLQDDLRRCLEELQVTGSISDFFPGQTDKAHQLQFCDYLYGRDKELQQITQLISDNLSAKASILMVSGYSGVGKTTLVQQAIRQSIGGDGFFIQGKFDQTLNQPYAAFVTALNKLVSDIKTQGKKVENDWKQILNKAIWPNGQVLIDFMPNLEEFLGKQEAVMALESEQAKNRFNSVCQQFVNAIVNNGSPLILFLDDLQWIDAASLDLIQILIEHVNKGFLLVGAYRDNECESEHILSQFLQSIQNYGGQHIRLTALSQTETSKQISTLLHEIPLKGIQPEDIKEQMQDLFKRQAKEVAPLADLIYSKTHGNPFFTKQLLTSLHEQGLIQYELQYNKWTWDLDAINEQNVADNVGEFMVKQFHLLPTDTQELLLYASCLGHEFSLDDLSQILKKDALQLELTLWTAVNRGLVSAIEKEQKRYKFLHDRIQQAAYQSKSEQATKEYHLTIAKGLEAANIQHKSKALFKIVDHYNLAADAVPKQDLKHVLDVNCTAIQIAKQSAAFDSAYRYVNKCIKAMEHIQVTDEQKHHIHCQLAHCEYLVGNYDAAETQYKALLHENLNISDKIDCYCKCAVLYVHTGRPDKAVELLGPALALLGIKLPKKIRKWHNKALYYRFRRAFSKASRGNIKAIDETMPEDTKNIIKIHKYFSSPTYMVCKDLHVYHRFISSLFDMSYRDEVMYTATISHFISYEHKLAYAKTIIADCKDVIKSRKHPDSKDYYVMGGYITPYFHPLSEAILDLKASTIRSKNHGEIMFSSFSIAILTTYKYIAGQNLRDFIKDCEENIKILEMNKEITALVTVKELPFVAKRLIDATPIEEDEVAAIADSLGQVPFQIGLFLFYLSLVQYYLIHNNYEKAKQYINKVSQVPNGSLGMLHDDEYKFYKVLTHFMLAQEQGTFQRLKTCITEQKDLRWIKKLAELNPSNFRHMYYFLLAEQSCVFRKSATTAFYYQTALKAALDNGFIQYAALISERAGEPEKALEYYQKWGADAKVKQLKDSLKHST